MWLKYKTIFRLLGTCWDTLILKIGPPSQKLQMVPKIAIKIKFCPNFEGLVLQYTEKRYFFILFDGFPMHWDSSCQKSQKSLGEFLLQPPLFNFFLKFFKFFANDGSKRGPIKIWLKYKNVFRLRGTCLDSLILKIGPPSEKLWRHPEFCGWGQVLIPKRGRTEKSL